MKKEEETIKALSNRQGNIQFLICNLTGFKPANQNPPNYDCGDHRGPSELPGSCQSSAFWAASGSRSDLMSALQSECSSGQLPWEMNPNVVRKKLF